MSKEYKEGDEYKIKNNKYILERFVHHSTGFGNLIQSTGLRTVRPITEYDVWEAKDKNGNLVLIKIKASSNSWLNEEESSNRERLSFIDDEHEVNLLTDSYEEWINNKRDQTIVDPMLLSKRLEHIDFLAFLKFKARQYVMLHPNLRNNAKKMAYGWRLLYYHRTVPSYMGHKLFDRFCKENPDLWEKMKVDIRKWKDEYKQKKKRGSEASNEGLVEG